MKHITTILTLALVPMMAFAQAPAESEDVMLQGFYWDSQKETGWTNLQAMSEDIAKSFTLVWLPPSAGAEGGTTVGGNNVGYHPRQWNSQNSCWGTAENLKNLISGLHTQGVKVIADIVINHRAGDTGWGNFTADDFGNYGSYQLTAANICSSDEMNTDASAGSWKGQATGAADTGENWGGARDLDHTSTYVQEDCKAYLAWLKGEYGYDGWRYDFVKGFGGKYVGLYNEASQPYLSVGEYWDGSYDKVAAWINATGKQSMAFDFPMKYDALNNGLAKGDYSKMTWIEDNTTWRPAGMIHHHNYNRYAVTFVDNHDTYRDASKFTGYVEQAYAFILSSPGVPCVFYPHWKKSTSTTKAHIEAMIRTRRACGIHSESDVEVTVKDKYYESHSVGHHGELITRIGFAAPKDVPTGYKLACNGTNWWMYVTENVDAAIHEVGGSTATVDVAGGRIEISNPRGAEIHVYDAQGHQIVASGCEKTRSLALPAGVYLVKVGEQTQKVSI